MGLLRRKPKRVPPPGNAGWFMKMLMGEYLNLAADKYPGWERGPDGKPHGVRLRIQNKKHRSSDDIGEEWDGLANSRFYWYEVPDGSSVFLYPGDWYTAHFTFQTLADRDRFHELYGGVKS